MLKKQWRKLAALGALAVVAATAFATLGDGKVKSDTHNKKSLLSGRTVLTPGTFSLKSGYNFRGNEVLTFEKDRYININTVVTYQKGNSTYIMPLKKKVFLDKITFNPNPATRN